MSREDDTPHTVRFRHCTEAASSAVAHCYDLTGGVRACRINVCSKQRKVEEKRKQREEEETGEEVNRREQQDEVSTGVAPT